MDFLKKLLGRADKPAPASAAKSQPRKAAPKGLAVPRPASALRPVVANRRVTQMGDLPGYSEILTGEHGTVKLGDSQRVDAIACRCGQQEAFIVLSERTFGSLLQKTLTDDLQRAGYQVVSAFEATTGFISSLYTSSEDEASMGSESAMQEAVDSLLRAALASDVSDVHIETRATEATIRFRRHGKLYVHDNWSADYAHKFARTLHTMADDDSKQTTFIESESQAMSVSRNIDGQQLKLRVQTLQAYPNGFDVVNRMLRVGASTRVRSLEELGYAPGHIEMLELMLSNPSGVVCLAGTTGSGKTTTLQTMLDNLYSSAPHKKYYSVEDPPEYVLKGVTQIPVTRRRNAPKDANPFADAMRDAMRADPDVVMVGEVRDSESSSLLTAIVQSGHQVLTTTHASGALPSFERLNKLGIDMPTLASKGYISGVIYQTLVPVLCQHCKKKYVPGETELPHGVEARLQAVIREGDEIYLWNEKGCEHCSNLGVTGRTVCAEMVIPDKRMLELIRQGNMNGAYDHWRAFKHQSEKHEPGQVMKGMTALDHALMKMRKGLLSPLDVEEALGHLTGYDEDDGLIDSQTSNLLD